MSAQVIEQGLRLHLYLYLYLYLHRRLRRRLRLRLRLHLLPRQNTPASRRKSLPGTGTLIAKSLLLGMRKMQYEREKQGPLPG